MSGEFLEERLPVAVRMGASYADEYAVEITQTASGSESRRLVHPYPVRIYNIKYTQHTADIWDQILSLYHRTYGMYAGFRVKAVDDYTTKNRTSAPTAIDQTLKQITATTYQLQVAYGGAGSVLGIGKPYRTIFKPVAGTVKIAIAGVEQFSGWSVSTTTGIVTFSSAPGGAVTGGCEFDLACRFNSRIDVNGIAYGIRETGEIEIIELLNP